MCKSKIFLGLGSFSSYNDKQLDFLNYCFKNGIRFFDTAEAYGDSEYLLGKFINDKVRSDIVISTKTKIPLLSHIDIIDSCYSSLKKIGTTYIDIFFVHYPNDNLNIRYVIGSLLFLKKKGFIKNIGFSNISYSRLKYYHKILKKDLSYIQINFNCINRYAEKKGILKYCYDNDINVMTWGTFNQNNFLYDYDNIFLLKNYDIYKYLLYYNIYKYSNIYPIIGVSSKEHFNNLFNSDFLSIKKDLLNIEKKILEKGYSLDDNKFL